MGRGLDWQEISTLTDLEHLLPGWLKKNVGRTVRVLAVEFGVYKYSWGAHSAHLSARAGAKNAVAVRRPEF